VICLGIDAGASSTKWVLLDGDKTVALGKELAMDGHIYRASSKVRMKEVIKSIAQHAVIEEVAAIYLGITGLVEDPTVQTEIMKIVNESFPKAKFRVATDLELAYRSHFETGEGILLYAGTGSICAHITTDHKLIQIGGWGYLLGDEGAGYWIGREAIRESLLDIESGTRTEFSQSILKSINCSNWGDIKSFVYSNERSSIARIAILVNQLALQQNLVAQVILDQATQALLDLVKRMDKKIDIQLPVAFAGGVSQSEYLTELMAKSEIATRLRIAQPSFEMKAAQLASQI
jgi:glucosamine kinase